MNAKIMLAPDIGEAIEKVLMSGDLSSLTTEQRLTYVNGVCKSLGVNPLTKPFEYIKFQGKTILYATRGCADQLRKIHNVSIDEIKKEKIGDLYVVTAAASIGSRKDIATAALETKNLQGTDLANALMKTETKAKRRVTLSICGLGCLDESEVADATETIVQEKVIEANKRFEEPPKVEVLEGPETKPSFIAVQTDYNEREKQQRLKDLGFTWDKGRKLWVNSNLDVANEITDIEYIIL